MLSFEDAAFEEYRQWETDDKRSLIEKSLLFIDTNY